MNLEFEILKERSKRQAVKISKWIGNDEKRFAELMNVFLTGEYRAVQRSAWIVSFCAENHPRLIMPWIARMVKRAAEPNVHNAVKRNVVRVLQFVDIPKNSQGAVANLCFDFLKSVDAPIAVKAFSMTVLVNIAAEEPDLKREIALTVEEMLPYGSPGIRSHAKKVLRQLSR